MDRLILLKDKKAKKQIKTAFGASDMVMSYALTFTRNSEKDIKIRIAAMKGGGKLLYEVTERCVCEHWLMCTGWSAGRHFIELRIKIKKKGYESTEF